MERELYRERAHLVALLAAVFPSTIGYTDPSEPDWAVVTVGLASGQVTWHIAPDDMDLFEHVTPGSMPWDGHTTAEKYGRIRRETAAVDAGGVYRAAR